MAAQSIALGDSLFVDGDYDGAVDHYTAAIRQTAVVTTSTAEKRDDDNDADKETTLLHFRALSHRAEAHLRSSNCPRAYNDAAAALALFPPRDAVDASTAGPRALALAHDRVARAAAKLTHMCIGGRSRKTGRVAFVKIASAGMGSAGEMEAEAREHWEKALALAGMLDDGKEVNEGGEGANEKTGERGRVSEGARLVEIFQKALRKLDGEEGEEKEEEKQEEKGKIGAGFGNIGSMMGSMMAAGEGGSSTSQASATSAKSSAKATAPPPPRPSSSGPSYSPPKPSNHPAMFKERTPVDRGVMSGMPKYQYYQDDDFMKIQILEPHVQAQNLSTEFTADEISVKIKKQHEGGLVEYVVVNGDLYEEVVPERCRAIIKGEKVLIKLKKKEKMEWAKLLDEGKGGERKKVRAEKRAKEVAGDEGAEEGAKGEASANKADENGNVQNNAAIPTTTVKHRPYSSTRDWDAIDRNLAAEEAKEKPEGDEALNSLFSQIYKNANEDTRRAMVKSMQTSGGTCLSTNWGEVEKTDYEKERQAPKGMEWKDSEGTRLPQKDND